MAKVVVTPGVGIRVTAGETPPLAATEVLIAPRYSYISAGTELKSVVGARDASPGDESRPLGYSQAGTVLAAGADVQRVAAGDRVVAIGRGAFHATRTVVGQNLVVPVPAGVALAEASIAAMFCFALEAVHKSRVRLGQKVVVFGAGLMGQLAARLYRMSGAEVAVVDGLEFRRDHLPTQVLAVAPDARGWTQLGAWAQPYGVEHACIGFGGDATDSIERLKPLMSTGPDGVSAGRIVFPGGAAIHLMMASAMGNIELLSSAKAGPGYRDAHYESGADYPAAYVRHPVRRNIETMINLLQNRRLDVSELITHRYPYVAAADAYRALRERPGEIVAALLDYGETN